MNIGLGVVSILSEVREHLIQEIEGIHNYKRFGGIVSNEPINDKAFPRGSWRNEQTFSVPNAMNEALKLVLTQLKLFG